MDMLEERAGEGGARAYLEGLLHAEAQDMEVRLVCVRGLGVVVMWLCRAALTVARWIYKRATATPLNLPLGHNTPANKFRFPTPSPTGGKRG